VSVTRSMMHEIPALRGCRRLDPRVKIWAWI
jgi:hypothetical protein